MDYFNARYFGAALGRFTSPVPANAGADIANPQSWNAYAYVLGNPLALVDPSGLDAFGNGGDDGGDPCFEDPFLCGGFPPISFPIPEAPGPPPPPPTTTESASSGSPLPPGSFPGGETLGLPLGMKIPGPLSWQVLLGLWGWDCAGGVCVPGFGIGEGVLNTPKGAKACLKSYYSSGAGKAINFFSLGSLLWGPNVGESWAEWTGGSLLKALALKHAAGHLGTGEIPSIIKGVPTTAPGVVEVGAGNAARSALKYIKAYGYIPVATATAADVAMHGACWDSEGSVQATF